MEDLSALATPHGVMARSNFRFVLYYICWCPQCDKSSAAGGQSPCFCQQFKWDQQNRVEFFRDRQYLRRGPLCRGLAHRLVLSSSRTITCTVFTHICATSTRLHPDPATQEGRRLEQEHARAYPASELRQDPGASPTPDKGRRCQPWPSPDRCQTGS